MALRHHAIDNEDRVEQRRQFWADAFGRILTDAYEGHERAKAFYAAAVKSPDDLASKFAELLVDDKEALREINARLEGLRLDLVELKECVDDPSGLTNRIAIAQWMASIKSTTEALYSRLGV